MHPQGGSNPQNETPLVIWEGGAGEERLQFRFVPVPGEGHYGYIENVQTKRIVHPESGYTPPDNGTRLVFHEDRHIGALFMYDSVDNVFIHKQGKTWHPRSGSGFPGDGTELVMWDGSHKGSTFVPVNASIEEINIYP